jgi:hypothetical protein
MLRVILNTIATIVLTMRYTSEVIRQVVQHDNFAAVNIPAHLVKALGGSKYVTVTANRQGLVITPLR